MNKNESNIVNVFGSFFLIYMCLEYLLVLGDVSIQLHLILLAMTAIYYIIFRTFKKSYIPMDDIIGWFIMSLVSIAVFYAINHFGYTITCSTFFCIKGYRDLSYLISNFAFFGVMIIINIFTYFIRLISFRKNNTRKF
jgi:hypothetical protein